MDIIYKYLSPERIDKVLLDGTFRASQLDVLNDPFEALPDFTEYENYLDDKLRTQFPNDNREKVEMTSKLRRNIRNQIPLIVCFSEKNNNLLMWSHYAKAHSGFVVGVDANHQFFTDPTFGSNQISGLSKVEYSKDRAVFPNTEEAQQDPNKFLPILLRKSLDWSYEQEWRIHVQPEACKSIRIANDHECFLLEWPPDLLAEIIIGPKMSLADQAKILELRRAKYPRAELFIAELSPTKYDLDIRYFFSTKG